MTQRRRHTGTGWPDGPLPGDRRPTDSASSTDSASRAVGDGSVVAGPGAPAAAGRDRGLADAQAAPVRASARRMVTSAGLGIVVLLGLLGFALIVQVKNNSVDPTLAAARQEDLVRILSDLEAREERLRQDIAELEESQRQLTSGAQGRQAALAEATRRADELGILAGRLPATGPGLLVRFAAGGQPISAAVLLDAVQELRGAGAEAMQVRGGDGSAVRIVAGTYFLDADGGVEVSGVRLAGPFEVTVIGEPTTMRTALNIPGGVVASVSGGGGTVIVEERDMVEVTALSDPKVLRYARPVS